MNGSPASHPALMIAPERDTVTFDGRVLNLRPRHTYWLLNKPQGYVTTLRDTHGRPHVVDLLPASGGRVFPVGRLDLDTEGLLLLTDDGDLAYRLTHPRFKVEKTYRAKVQGIPGQRELRRLERGIVLEDGATLPSRARLVRTVKGNAVLELTLREGRKRQVKRMCKAIGHPVLELRRVRLGPLKLGTLPRGQVRELTEREVGALRECAGLAGTGTDC